MASKKPKGLGMGLEALLGPKVQDAAPDTPVDASLPTTLLKVIGKTTMPVTTSVTVVWGQSKLWVALVLERLSPMARLLS